MATDNGQDAAGKAGGKYRLLTLDDLDKRTNAAKACFDLRDRIIADLGGEGVLSAMQREIIDNAAVMGAILKHDAAAYLSGGSIDLAGYTTLANAQRRLLACLGLERRARDVTPDIQTYMSRRAKERAA